MRDATSVEKRLGRHLDAGRFFTRAFAIALAVASFSAYVSPAQGQTVDAVAENLSVLARHGTVVVDHRSRTDRKAGARIVAARIDDLAAHPASRADVETLRELVDALKDELDAANVRIDRLQERLDAAAASAKTTAPELLPNSHVGAPLDPLALEFARNSCIAARLWGTDEANMSVALAGLDTSSVSTDVNAGYLASLDPTDRSHVYEDVATALFSHDARFMLSTLNSHDAAPLFYAEIAYRSWSPDLLMPELQAVAFVAENAKADQTRIAVQQSIHGLDLPVLATAMPSRSISPIVASIHNAPLAYVARHNALAVTTQANVEFDHALRAAGEMSSLHESSPVSSYPMFTQLSDSTLGDLASAYRAYAPTKASSGIVTAPIRLGRAKLTTKTSLQHVDQGTQDASASAALLSTVSSQNRLHYDAATVDTSIVVPAFHKNVTINVRGAYDHLHRPDTTTLPYYQNDASTMSNYEVPSSAGSAGTSALAASPNNIDVRRYTYGASAALPVTHSIKVGVGYSSQHLSGTYGVTPGEPPADRKDAYSGSLTYAPRGGKSSVTIVGREYRYSDDASPNTTYKETRGDVLFSMKF